jgi:hypothetical protein
MQTDVAPNGSIWAGSRLPASRRGLMNSSSFGRSERLAVADNIFAVRRPSLRHYAVSPVIGIDRLVLGRIFNP